MPDTFYNIKATCDKVRYSFFYGIDGIKILLETDDVDNFDLDSKFLNLYEYIFILIGYYPVILKGPEFDINEISEKYKTSEKHMIPQTSFVNNLSTDRFIDSYKRFLELKEKILFQIDYYSIATSKFYDCYPQIAIVNVLQCLDGIYDNVEATKNYRRYMSHGEAKKVKKTTNDVNVQQILKDDDKITKFISRLSDTICRVEEYDYTDKLKFVFNHVNINYGIFNFEKNQEDDTYFDRFIEKCKNTRNKFSHGLNKIDNYFNGKESIFYLYKLLLVFRLLIIEELKLDSFINKDLLQCIINDIDEN